jgi:hypothetical protein
LNSAGAVVAREYGYNRRAEALREEALENREGSLSEIDIEPIPPGGTDSFRMFFFREGERFERGGASSASANPEPPTGQTSRFRPFSR